MTTAEFKNGPNLCGWAIGCAAGLVAFSVAVVVGKFDFMPAAFIAALVALVVGAILGLPWGAEAANVGAEHAMRAGAADRVEADIAEPSPMPVASVSSAVVDAPSQAQTQDGPLRLSAPRGGKADDLKEIEGIGPALEALCNQLGFYHFDQIAGWTDADVAWVDQNMARFKGRIIRDKWVAQARIIVSEGLEAFRERAKTNSY